MLRFLHQDNVTTAATVQGTASNINDTTVVAAASMDDDNSDAIFHKMMALTHETPWERTLDILLALLFAGIAIVAARRMQWSRQQILLQANHHAPPSAAATAVATGAAETTVVTAFYALILVTSVLRAIWFGIPNSVWQPSYTPLAVYAFDKRYSGWMGAFGSQVIGTAGSLALLSIFILILVYWADILKKYFYPGARRSRPMTTFVTLVLILTSVEMLNLLLFLLGCYTTEGMILYDAMVLATVSIVCVCQITIFSQRFRTVLKTLGAINQVSTDAQVRRIVWITVTGNLFFFTRAFLETIFALLVITYWMDHHSVAKLFSHAWWDTYIMLKYSSEVAILALMLYILQSRFANGGGGGNFGPVAAAQAQQQRRTKQEYQAVPDTETTPLVQSADV
jgi:hypothetical protein